MFSDLDPNCFEWLELAESAYQKKGGYRTIPFREVGDKEYVFDDFRKEYEHLSQLHDVAGEQIAEPYLFVEGEDESYFMEPVDGERIRHYLEENPAEASTVIQSLDDVLDTLHQKDLFHGDLGGNVLVTEDAIKIIDPIGAVDLDEELIENMKKKDRKYVDNLRDQFSSSVSTSS